MDFDEKQYQCGELQAKDADKLKALLEQSGKYEALEMKANFAEGFTGWWYGAYANNAIVATAYITKQFVYLFGRDRDGMLSMGKSLGRAQGKRSGSTTHSVFGPKDMVQAFWSGFQITDKSIVSDTTLNLHELTEIACKLNDAYAVRIANKKDLPLVFEFMGEALIDELGVDMRRTGKEAHEKYCQQLIETGSVILGYHRGKPAFIARYSETPVGIFVENAHFPVAMRRPKVIRGIHARVGELLLEKAEAVLIYLDVNDAEQQAAFEEVGYRPVNTARLMRLR